MLSIALSRAQNLPTRYVKRLTKCRRHSRVGRYVKRIKCHTYVASQSQ